MQIESPIYGLMYVNSLTSSEARFLKATTSYLARLIDN